VTAVTDNARLREGGPILGGEVGGLAFGARGGMVIEGKAERCSIWCLCWCLCWWLQSESAAA
jgi:hypothetical protein